MEIFYLRKISNKVCSFSSKLSNNLAPHIISLMYVCALNQMLQKMLFILRWTYAAKLIYPIIGTWKIFWPQYVMTVNIKQ